MTKEKFTEMYKNQQNLFSDRLTTNHKLMDLEVSIIQNKVIKSNAKKEELEINLSKIDKVTSKDLKVKMLNHLLQQNRLTHKLSKSQMYHENNDDLRLAENYYKMINEPEKVVEDYNKANKYEQDIRISK